MIHRGKFSQIKKKDYHETEYIFFLFYFDYFSTCTQRSESINLSIME